MSHQTEEDLIKKFMPMVYHNKRRITLHGRLRSREEDLVAVGVIGLLEGIRSYAPDRGMAMHNWVYSRIRWSMLRELARWKREVRTFSDSGVAEDERAQGLLACLACTGDPDDPLRLTQRAELAEKVKAAMRRLTDLQRRLLDLTILQQMDLKRAAEALGFTPQRASQVYHEAITKLARYSGNNRLDTYRFNKMKLAKSR